jgi:hypothetical protein
MSEDAGRKAALQRPDAASSASRSDRVAARARILGPGSGTSNPSRSITASIRFPKRCLVDEIQLEIKGLSGELRLEIGETVVVRDGLKGVVMARYIPSGQATEVRYIVAVQSAQQPKRSR